MFEKGVNTRFKQPDNNLLVKFPIIAMEFDSEKNGITPDKVYPNSNKKYWFNCPKGHSYFTVLTNRTRMGSNCPKCSYQTSKNEVRVYSELKYIFGNVIHRRKLRKTEFDIFLTPYNLVIEYDGQYYHKGREQRDLKKNRFCNMMGMKVMRVRETPLNKLSDLDVMVTTRPLSKNQINEIILQLMKKFPMETGGRLTNYLNEKQFMNDNYYRSYVSNLPNPPLKESLLKTHPKIASLWDYEKNYPLKPEQFKAGSNAKVFFKCKEKGHSKEYAIYNRVKLKTGCPICVNFGDNHPELLKELHPTKNPDFNPYKVTQGSSKKVWWKCSKGHEYKTTIVHRTKEGTGCWKCYRERRKTKSSFSNDKNQLNLF